MSIVGITTFENEGPRKYFTLKNEQYLRQFDPNWSTISVGILCSVEATASISNTNGCGMWVGLGSFIVNGNSGFKNMESVVAMTGGGFGRVGQSIYGNSGPLTYGTDAAGSYISFDFSTGGKIVNGSLILSFGSGVGYFFMTAPTGSENGRKCLLTFQFNQISTTVGTKINPLTTFVGSPPVERYSHTDGTMFSAITEQYNSSPTVNGVIENQGGSFSSLAKNNSQPLDTLNIFWTGSIPIRIYQIAISRTS